MSQKNWKNFCIIGSGNHTVTKIIPALIAEEKRIKGIVSSKKNTTLTEFKRFENIKKSLQELPKDTVFVIATPPTLHFRQAKAILKYGRDVIIEKPIFISATEVQEILSLVNSSKNIVLEGFMHRYTKLYIEFMKFWNKEKNNIVALKSSFCIPEIPKKTFRNKKDIASSCLYDMGCYGLSLLNDMELDLKEIKIKSFEKINSRIINILLTGIVNNISVDIKFGENKDYENYVEIITKKNKTIKFFPFFYGRKALKSIEYCTDDDIRLEQFNDYNAFQSMFNDNRENLILNQKVRINKSLIVTKKLESLAKELKILTNKKNTN